MKHSWRWLGCPDAGARLGAVEQVSGASRFWTANGKHPEPNSDTVNLREAYKYLPFTFSTSSWDEADSQALRREVVAVVQVGHPCMAPLRVLRPAADMRLP